MATIVDGCTDTDPTPKPPWRARKEAYLAHLTSADRSTQLVSAADKLHNVRSLADDYRTAGEDVWDRFNGGRDGTLWYYRAVLERSTSSPARRSSTSSAARSRSWSDSLVRNPETTSNTDASQIPVLRLPLCGKKNFGVHV